MPRPPRLPTWATDTNFPAGTDPWSSQPTKDTPSGGEIGTGFIPQEMLPAERLNYLLGLVGDWATYLDTQDEAIVINEDFMKGPQGSGSPTVDDVLGTYFRVVTDTNCDIADGQSISATFSRGLLKVSSNANSMVFHAAAAIFRPLTADWRLTARIRVEDRSKLHATSEGFSIGIKPFIGDSGARAVMAQSGGTGNWKVLIGSGAAIDSGVTITDATFYDIEFNRVSELITLKINGTVVGAVEDYDDSATDPDGAPAVVSFSSGSSGAAVLAYVDNFRLRML